MVSIAPCTLNLNGLPLLNRVEEVELAGVSFIVEVNRIVAGETCVAEALGLAV